MLKQYSDKAICHDTNSIHGLYLITPDWDDTDKLLYVTEEALLGGAACVQYRHKTASLVQRFTQATALLDLCQQYQVPFILNDPAEALFTLNVDGVHVGSADMTIVSLRARLGEKKIIGASCYGEITLALAAYQAGASYVAFGGFYPSRVKQYSITTTTDIITQAQRAIPLPIVVIGGMTPQNAAHLVQAGAKSIAVISSVYGADNPRAAAQEFLNLFTVKNQVGQH